MGSTMQSIAVSAEIHRLYGYKRILWDIEDYSRIQRSQKDIGSTGDLQIADLFDEIYNAIIVDD